MICIRRYFNMQMVAKLHTSTSNIVYIPTDRSTLTKNGKSSADSIGDQYSGWASFSAETMLFESDLLNSNNYADMWTVLSLGQVTIMNDALNRYREEYTGCWPVQCALRNVNTVRWGMRRASLNAAHNKGIPSSINQHFNQLITCHNRGLNNLYNEEAVKHNILQGPKRLVLFSYQKPAVGNGAVKMGGSVIAIICDTGHCRINNVVSWYYYRQMK